MGKTCTMSGSAYKCITFMSEILKGRGLLEKLGINGSIIIKWILNKHGRVWWGLMSQDCDQWAL